MCEAARTATTSGAVKKKPMVVPTAVRTAVQGEMNIAIKIGTCAINVALYGPTTILNGGPTKIIGIRMPIAIRSAETTRSLVLSLVFKICHPFVGNSIQHSILRQFCQMIKLDKTFTNNYGGIAGIFYRNTREKCLINL